MIYLTGSSSTVKRVARELGLGLLVQPGNYTWRQLHHFDVWAADNGCFAQGEAFDVDAFLAWLDKLRGAPGRCLFAVAPDVLGDPRATLARSRPVLARIRALGFPAAFVAQDGLTPRQTPWDEFDALFLGGRHLWKVSPDAHRLADAARARGKWLHMGRVNSERRLRTATLMGCASADGTFIRYAPDLNVERLRRWFDAPVLFE